MCHVHELTGYVILKKNIHTHHHFDIHYTRNNTIFKEYKKYLSSEKWLCWLTSHTFNTSQTFVCFSLSQALYECLLCNLLFTVLFFLQIDFERVFRLTHHDGCSQRTRNLKQASIQPRHMHEHIITYLNSSLKNPFLVGRREKKRNKKWISIFIQRCKINVKKGKLSETSTTTKRLHLAEMY